MNKIFFIYFFFLFPSILFSQQVVIEPVINKNDIFPGNTYSVVLKITNNSNKSLELSPNIKLSHNWYLTSKLNNFSISPQKSTIRIINISIPSTAQEGKHQLLYSIEDVKTNVFQTKTINVNVSKVVKLSLYSLNIPNFVKAGDSINMTFILKNEGNSEQMIKLLSKTGSTIKGGDELILAPDEIRILELNKPTNLNLGKASVETIVIKALVTNEAPYQVSSYGTTTIIPVEPISDDVYKRFPVSITTTYVGQERNNQFDDGFQGEIYGNGSLDLKNKHFLEFRAVGPDRLSLSSFNQYEEYFVNYKSPNTKAHIGDKSFSSSLLTEYVRYGRGVSLERKIKKLSVGGFYNKPRFYSGIEQEFSVYTNFKFDKKTNIEYGYLSKYLKNGNTANLHYLDGEINPFKNTKIEGEYSISNENDIKGYAYQFAGESYFKPFRISGQYLYASQTYSGYFNNTKMFFFNLNSTLSKNISFTSNYRYDAKNFKEDELYGSAPINNSFRFGINYSFLKNGYLSLNAGSQEREDRMEDKKFHYKENFMQVDFSKTIGLFDLDLDVRYAKTDNFLTQKTSKSKIVNANISFEKFKCLFNLFTSYSNTNRYDTSNEDYFVFGGNVLSNFSEKTTIGLFYQNSYSLENYYRDRNLFELRFNHKFLQAHEIDISSRYSLMQQEIDKRDIVFSIKYILHLNVPIKRKYDYGILTGKITSSDNTNVEGIKLYLDDNVAITDRIGDFMFTDIKPGNKFVEIDKSTIGIHDITTVLLPKEIDVKSGENFLTFGIVKSSKLVGTILFDNKDKRSEITKNESIIVEIKNDKEVFRKICPLNEKFVFKNLRPGTWHIRVYRNGLSKQFKINTKNFVVNLEANEEKVIDVEIVKQAKKIKYQQKSIKIKS